MLTTMNDTSPPPVVKPDKPADPKNDGGSALSVAAPAISLGLVLAAIVIWFFLVRVQLRRKEKKGYRLNNSKHSSQDDSLHEGHSGRHNGHKRLSSSSSRKNGGLGKKKHYHCSCRHGSTPRQSGSCNCGLSSPQSSNSQEICNGISTVCTGNSPFCPHSNRMRHHVDIHSPGSSSVELGSDYPLSEQGGLFGYAPRSRSNTVDFIPHKSHSRHQRGRGSGDVILRGTEPGSDDMVGVGSPQACDPLLQAGCSCHPLDRFEYRQCSCVLEHTPERRNRAKDRASPSAGLYFSAPSLVDKHLVSPC